MKSDLPERSFEFAKRTVVLCQSVNGKPECALYSGRNESIGAAGTIEPNSDSTNASVGGRQNGETARRETGMNTIINAECSVMSAELRDNSSFITYNLELAAGGWHRENQR